MVPVATSERGAKKIRIAYFSYVYAEDGGSVHTKEFLCALRGLGHEVHVLWQNRIPDMAARMSLRHRVREYLKTRLSRWLHEPKELFLNIPFFLKERRFIRQVRPDVLIVRHDLLRFSSVLLGRLYGIPVVLEVNAPGCLESSQYFSEYWHMPILPEMIEKRLITRADALVTVSQALQEFLIRVYDIPPAIITVNPNGADPERFDPDRVQAEIVPTIPENATVVGFCASFQEFHGVDRIVDIAVALADLPQVHFLLVGDGPARADVQKKILAAGQENRVSMVGHIPHDHVPTYLARMDIGIMPKSNFYGSPMKIIEYMAMGLPVIGPRLGPLKEIVEEGVQGFLFSPDNVAELSDYIRRLVVDKDLRRSMGDAARARVLRELTWAHNAQRVELSCHVATARKESSR